MKFKVGDKVKFTPHYSFTDKYRIGVVTKASTRDFEVRVKYSIWLNVSARRSELTLLSPVEVLLYDWEQGEEKE